MQRASECAGRCSDPCRRVARDILRLCDMELHVGSNPFQTSATWSWHGAVFYRSKIVPYMLTGLGLTTCHALERPKLANCNRFHFSWLMFFEIKIKLTGIRRVLSLRFLECFRRDINLRALYLFRNYSNAVIVADRTTLYSMISDWYRVLKTSFVNSLRIFFPGL